MRLTPDFSLWYEKDDSYLYAHQSASSLIDLVLSRDINEHQLLKHTGLFLQDIQQGHVLLSPRQLIQLIANSDKYYPGNDLPFLWGNRIWPGSSGPFSQALTTASTLGEALDHLIRFRSMLSPLFAPRKYHYKGWVFIHWLDVCGCGKQQSLVLIAMMTALSNMTRWLSAMDLPWRFFLQQSTPLADEQFNVHWNGAIQFDAQLNMMAIPAEYIDKPWPNASPTSFKVASQECQQLIAANPPQSFIDLLYIWLLDNIANPINLEQTAKAFAMSPATLKRKLQRHDVSFQQLADDVRKQVALYLIAVRNMSNEEIAQYLGYHDANNLRRSFRRWTGLTPSSIRQHLKQIEILFN